MVAFIIIAQMTAKLARLERSFANMEESKKGASLE